ncbi:fluoride efflux transporter FluC [Nakamurella endophytica]|uniref:Fluoride-specific ion channel FluC n=1 Tax=Nakamurella endophytica TaxID=1748367 RepID=A0A917SVK9_9ACTN|nr:CrcB family protein [Nakamurella endophytica]GGM00972.1 putative fluoride ion transporter CrcB 2 [Nakamurella endophytica]
MTGYLWVALGAAVGAPLRYLTDRWVQRRHRSRMPWGTWVVNVAGSAVLGAVTGLVSSGLVGADVSLLLGTGLCGALTTWSTLAFETVRLAEQRAFVVSAANLASSIAVGVAAAALGRLVGSMW